MEHNDFDKQKNECEKIIRVKIDDYFDTIHAILGFCSLWFYDTTTQMSRLNIKVFQGRRLTKINDLANEEKVKNEICPDFGIVINNDGGILGEVKKNFPKNEENERQKTIFDQLKSYDNELDWWPTNNGKLNSHNIVLVVHQSTSRRAQDYYSEKYNSKEIKFTYPFSICQFNRSDQRVPYYFFQLVTGEISNAMGNVDLYNGVQVPMAPLSKLYAKSPLYDAEPPLSYLLNLIWIHVVIPAVSENENFGRIKKNQTIELKLKVNDIIERLHEGFSFVHWHRDNPEHQPHIPKKEWIQKACNFLVKIEKAKWITNGEELTIYFTKAIEDISEYFIKLEAEDQAKEIIQPMFTLDNNK